MGLILTICVETGILASYNWISATVSFIIPFAYYLTYATAEYDYDCKFILWSYL